MSWFEIALFWGLFSSTFLVQIRLPLALSANNLAVPVFALALAFRARASVDPVRRAHRNLFRATALVYVWLWVSSLNSVLPALSARIAVKDTAYLIVGFSFLLVLHRPTSLRPALRTVYLILVALAALGVLEYWQPVFPFVALRGQPAIHPRVASLFVWPNQFGVLMAIAVALGATLQHGGYLRPVYFRAPLVLFLVALALSGSRDGWFVLATLLVVLAAVRVITIGQLVRISGAFALVLLTFPVSTAQLGLREVSRLPRPGFLEVEGGHDLSYTTSPAQTLTPRLQLWRAALGEIRRHPLTGIGLEVFSNTIGPSLTGQYGINTHDLLLNVTTELGLIGLALFVFWLWVLFRSGDPRDWTTSVPLLGIGLGQIFDCFTYDYAFMTFSFFFIASYASASRDRR
jgi:O-antigen ligase